MFKIVNTQTGLYSSGGRTPRWEKEGRVWQSFGSVQEHIRALDQAGQRTYTECNAVIVEFSLVVKNVTEMPAFPKPRKPPPPPRIVARPKRSMYDLRSAFAPKPRVTRLDVEKEFNRYIQRELHELSFDWANPDNH